MQKLDIQLSTRPEGTVAVFHGDASNIYPNQIYESLLPALTDHISKIVFDMSALDFIATEALGEIIAFWLELNDSGGSLRLAGANQNIEHVMQLTRLVELFPIYPDIESALTENL